VTDLDQTHSFKTLESFTNRRTANRETRHQFALRRERIARGEVAALDHYEELLLDAVREPPPLDWKNLNQWVVPVLAGLSRPAPDGKTQPIMM
jgi:hypothetical protein